MQINRTTNMMSTTSFSSHSTSNVNNFESSAINQTMLKWSSLGEGRQNFVVSSQSDISVLRNLKNVLLSLQNEFTEGGSKIIFTGDRKDDFNKRLILLESQISGLMKRKIDFTTKGDGSRILDYSGILNQKENQIVELQKKINNLEERLRKASARQIELENQVHRLFEQIKIKDRVIFSKNEIVLAQVSASNLFKQTLQKSGIALPNIGSFDIKADLLNAEGASSRSTAYTQLPENKKNKTQIIQLFRQLEKINSGNGITGEEIDQAFESFILNLEGSKFRQSTQIRLRRRRAQQDYQRLQGQFGAAVSIFQAQLEKIRLQNPNLRIQMDSQVYQMLKQHKINVYKTAGDIIHLQRFSQKTIQVPVQDARTKHLLHMFAVQMKKFTARYPKLLTEMDSRLTQFFQQQLIDIIEVDQVDRLVQIVKYVPQVVKVENVYAYSSEKSRKIQFHLRVLVKALLEQLQKIKKKTGVVLQMDQGVIGMINKQIMGVVDVDDILKIFRVVPKMVQVEKIVQKIVDRIVEVPQVVVVQKIVQKIVEVQKIKQVERIVNVPLQIPMVVTNIVEKIVQVDRIVEKIVQVPKYVDRIVQITKQVPKIIQVQKFIDRIVQVEKIIEVQRIVNHIQRQIKQVQVIKQIMIPSQEKIVERIVEVQVIVQKIVQKIVQVPQIIQVERKVQIAVPVIRPQIAKQIENHIQVRHQIVQRIVQKPIPIIQTVQKIVEVPQIIEKIIQTNTIIRQPYEVQVIRQKIVIQQRIKQIEVFRDRIVVQNRQIPKQVERIVQIPIIQEKLVKVTQIVQKPIIQRIENTVIKQVYLRDPQIIKQPKIIQVQKIINHYIEVPKPIKYIQEKIVQVIRHVDRIKQIKVPVEKIIEKMVEVPKVVQVEKIVQKIVVVPRVVQKIVQVIQIVQRIVPKIIIEERIKQVQRIIQKPVIQERPVEIQTIKNVYIEVQKIVERIVDKLVQVPRYEEKIINNDVIIEKVIEVIKQIPRQLQVEKIVYNTVEVAKPVQIQRQIIVPVQVPIPVEKIIEKIVPATEIIEKIVQVPQLIERIIPQRVEEVRIQQVTKVEQRVVIDQVVKQVVKQVPYISERIKEVVVEKEKIVPIQSIVQEVITAQQIIEKVVEKTITVPKIQQVQRTRQIVVQVPKIIEVERIIPQLVNVNKYIQKIVQKIVQVPIIIQQIKQVIRNNDKIIEVRSQTETVRQVEKIVEKAVVMEKFKQVVRNINHIEKVLQIIDRFEQTPVQVIAHQERLVEVPYILEKIVEKIVIMPQIVQVLKYVHEVFQEQTLGVAVGVEFASHQQRYKLLSKDLKANMAIFLAQIRKLRTTTPSLSYQIEIIEKFLAELQQFILFPRIVQVPKEKIVQRIVQRDNIVKIPSQDQRSIKMQLTLSLLVEKLILQLKKIKKSNPSLNLDLEDDIKLIFFSELQMNSKAIGDDFNLKLKQFSDTVYRKFESLGSWSFDHQMMLNTFLQERFMMANLVKNSNLQIQKSKNIQLKRQQAIKSYESRLSMLEGAFSSIRGVQFDGLSIETQSILKNVFSQFDQYKQSGIIQEKTFNLLDLQVTDQRIKSLIREKDQQINRLKSKIFTIEKSRTLGTISDSQGEIVKILQSENLKLKNQINVLRTQKGSAELVGGFKLQISQLNQRILNLEQEKSNLSAELSNLRRQYQVKLQMNMSSFKDSNITAAKSQFRSPQSSFKSPVSKYNMMGSPQQVDYGIKMVDSKIQDRSTGTVQSRNTGGYTSTSKEQVSYSSNMNSSNIVSDLQNKSRLTSYGANYQVPTYDNGRNSAMYSSVTSSQKDGVTYSGQYELQGVQGQMIQGGLIGQSQSSSYLPTNANSGFQANYYQSNNQLGGNTTNIQNSSTSSSFQSSFKSGTGFSSQSGGSPPVGGSSFSSSTYSYKKQ